MANEDSEGLVNTNNESTVQASVTIWFLSFITIFGLIVREYFLVPTRKLRHDRLTLFETTEVLWYIMMLSAVFSLIGCLSGFVEFFMYLIDSGTSERWCEATWYFGPTCYLFGRSGMYFMNLCCMYCCYKQFPRLKLQYLGNDRNVKYYGFLIFVATLIETVLVNATHTIKYLKVRQKKHFSRCDGFIPIWVGIILVFYDLGTQLTLLKAYITPLKELEHISTSQQHIDVVHRFIKIAGFGSIYSTFSVLFVALAEATTIQAFDGLCTTICVGLFYRNYLTLYKILQEDRRNKVGQVLLEEQINNNTTQDVKNVQLENIDTQNRNDH